MELRRQPPWLRVSGPATCVLQPGERGELHLTLVAAAAPALPRLTTLDLAARPDPTRGSPTGTFLVSASDEAREVGVWAWRGADARLALTLGALGGLWPWPFAVIVGFWCVRALWGREPEGTWDVRREVAAADRAAARRTLALLLALGTLYVALILGLFFVGGA